MKNLSNYEKFKIIEPYINHKISLTQIGIEKSIPLRTLNRWVKSYKTKGVEFFIKKSRVDKGKRRKIPNIIKEFIEGYALEQKRSISIIHKQACKVAEKMDVNHPSYSTVYNIVKSIPNSAITLAHQGSKVYEEKFDILCLNKVSRPNEVWQTDHCLLDILVEDQNHAVRPWLTIIIDSYSRAIAGYYLSFDSPSSIRVALALRQAIWNKKEREWLICGIPESFYTDNGSDFTSKHIETVCTDLKIRTIFSIPGKPRGRGKVERFFSTINQKLLCYLPGYIGNKNNKVPYISLTELDSKLKEFILKKYNREIHSSTKEVPIQRWSKDGFLPQMPESLEKLDLLLLTITKTRKIHPDGVHFQGLKYTDPTLAPYVGEYIMIRYDPRDMAEIRIFYQEKFLCRAICQEVAGEVFSLKDMIAARRRAKRELNKVISKKKGLVDQLLYRKKEKESAPIKTIKPIKSKIKLYENE